MPRVIYTTYTPEMLHSLIQRLDRLSGRLQAVAAWMEDQQLAKMQITNHSSMLQGLEHAEAFGHASERAADDHRLNLSPAKAKARPKKKTKAKRSR